MEGDNERLCAIKCCFAMSLVFSAGRVVKNRNVNLSNTLNLVMIMYTKLSDIFTKLKAYIP